jgi:hypothetical protein
MGPKLVALGSSFASGPGLKPYKSTEAMRSERNYASLLAKHLDADLIDLTSGGSTLLNIIEEPQGSLPRHGLCGTDCARVCGCELAYLAFG